MMVPYYKNIGTRIVASSPGPGTAETIYHTEDGHRWSCNPAVTPARQTRTAYGSGVGLIVGDHVFEQP